MSDSAEAAWAAQEERLAKLDDVGQDYVTSRAVQRCLFSEEVNGRFPCGSFTMAEVDEIAGWIDEAECDL